MTQYTHTFKLPDLKWEDPDPEVEKVRFILSGRRSGRTTRLMEQASRLVNCCVLMATASEVRTWKSSSPIYTSSLPIRF